MGNRFVIMTQHNQWVTQGVEAVWPLAISSIAAVAAHHFSDGSIWSYIVLFSMFLVGLGVSMYRAVS